jgi:hypothetical protein
MIKNGMPQADRKNSTKGEPPKADIITPFTVAKKNRVPT